MKRIFIVGSVFFMCLFLFGCDNNLISESTTNNISEKSLICVKLNGWGEEVKLDNEGDLSEFQELLRSFEFELISNAAVPTPPGSMSLSMMLKYSDGTIEIVTLPWCERDGKIYKTDPSVVKALSDAFFDTASEDVTEESFENK